MRYDVQNVPKRDTTARHTIIKTDILIQVR